MRRWLSTLLFSVILAGCSHHTTDAEKRTVSELTSHMTTHGLGRYLIDLPPAWRFGYGDVTLYYGLGMDFKTVEVEIVAQGVTPAQFQAAVKWRAQSIQSITNDKAHSSMLAGSWPVDVRIDDGAGGRGRSGVLLRYYDDTTLDNYHEHELHLLLGDTYVLLKADSFKGVIAPVEDRLKTLARQIFLVDDPRYTRAGFILGPIVIAGPQDHEQATVKFYDPQRLDVTLEINSSAVTPDESPHLLQRIDGDVNASDTPIQVLRRGQHDFAGMKGEEILGAFTEQDKRRELLFAAQTYRIDPGLIRPSFEVRLTTGGDVYWDGDKEHKARQAASDYLMSPYSLPNFIVTGRDPSKQPDPVPPVSSSLTDHEATMVWDAILPTIRLRVGAVAPPKPKDERPPPISREQAERDRQTLDDFIAGRSDGSPNTAGK